MTSLQLSHLSNGQALDDHSLGRTSESEAHNAQAHAINAQRRDRDCGRGDRRRRRQVYKIDGTPSWDLNAELQGRVPKLDGTFGGNPMPGEHENAVLANIPRERIVGASRIAYLKTFPLGGTLARIWEKRLCELRDKIGRAY